MNILLDNKEISDFSHTDGVNILSCKLIDEVHDGVFAITTSDNKTYIKEQKTTFNNRPVVEFNIHTGSALYKNVQFVLETNKGTKINFRKYPVASELFTEHAQQQQQLVTNNTPVKNTPTPKPKQAKQQITATQLREHIEQALVGLLTEGNNRNFNKFFELYTEGFKRDMVKISEKISRREMLRSLESGGGTNAAQFADGGTMRGTLNVQGNVNATDHLTGHLSLSSLDNDGAIDGQVLVWSDTYSQWKPKTNKVVSSIGDDINSVFVVAHGLQSMDLIVQVYDNTTQEVVYPHILNIGVNETQITFSTVPTANKYKVVIMS